MQKETHWPAVPKTRQGADMFVTLEPCCHHGKQPPCTEAIIEAKIAHVFVGSADPNPLVAGKGIGVLRKEGVCVTEGFLKEGCDELNKIFFYYITTKRPYGASGSGADAVRRRQF